MSETGESTLPRGVRNNNPGNIRKGIPWDGLASEQDDSAFDQFISPQYGIRALAKLLLAYQDFHGLRTLERMCARWAPASDNNDPLAYAQAVAQSMARDLGHPVGVRDPLILHDHQLLSAAVRGFIKVECAGYEYPPAVLYQGVSMADPGNV